jgi:magnesium transporter
LGVNYVLSIQEGAEGDVFDGVRAKLHNNVGGIRKNQADYLVYALLEAVIDSYFVILEDLGEKVEDLQDEMLENPSVHLLKQVRDLKRIARYLRRSVWPLREVLSELERADSPLINDTNNLFFRRAYEHTIQVMDIAESARDVLSDMLDIYLSSVSNRLNQVMKTLTIITTIFMPLTFIAGLYGMNFHFMPELGWRLGYPLILGVMGVIAVVMLIFFRRKEWL